MSGPFGRLERGQAPRRSRGVRPMIVLALAFAAVVSLMLFSVGTASAATPQWELTAIHGPTHFELAPSLNEVYTLTEAPANTNAGKFKLRFENQDTFEEFETKFLPFDATAAEVQAALSKGKVIGEGNVVVTGGPGPGTAYTIEFTGALGERSLGGENEESVFEVSEEETTEGEEKALEKEGKEVVELENVTVSLARRGFHDTARYQLIGRNLGGAPAGGSGNPVTLVDKLPAGTATARLPEGEGWTCEPGSKALEKQNKELKRPEGAGQTEVKCKSEVAVNPDGSAQPVVIEVNLDAGTLSEGQQIVNEAALSGGGAAPVAVKESALISSASAPFGIQDEHFIAAAYGENGEKYTQAGGRPYAATTSFFFNTRLNKAGQIVVPGNVKDADVKLPEGFVGNPQSVPRCTQSEFTQGLPGGPAPNKSCKGSSQVGTAVVYFKEFGSNTGAKTVGVYNLAPANNVPAEFGFIFSGVPVRIDAHVIREPGSDGTYRVTVLSPDINQAYKIYGVTLTLWGTPANASHTPERFVEEGVTGAPPEGPEQPFLTNPTDCVGEAFAPPTTTISVDRWEQPGALDGDGNPVLGDPNWLTSSATSPAVNGCNLLAFDPTIGFSPGTTQADEPSGFTFKLSVPQNESIGTLATPELKNTTVTLPPGVSISPSAANGLEACSDAQIALESIDRGSCPLGSQIGTVTIKSQLLEKPLNGRVYIGTPQCDPCNNADAESGRLFRLFIEAEGSGVRVKLPGTATANTTTGQLTTTFNNNPQLPFETLELTLKNGPRAPLATPQSCGTYTTQALLQPWSAGGALPGGEALAGTPTANPSFAFNVDWDGAGAGCPGTHPFGPSLVAGTESSKAGAYSPFDVTFSRHDREQDLSGITVTTPPGLLGKIAGITRCGEPDANNGTCPAGSRIATATSAAGAGTNPFVVNGPVYLTNGYKGAPFGLSIVVPANAGPFHLGNVIVRAAINVNPQTSALTITSDPLPQSRDGVPFRIQTVNVRVDKPEFMFNATNCDTKAIGATLTGAPVKAGEGAVTANLSTPYTATGCSSLPFKPVFTARTEAKTSKLEGASLRVRVAQPVGAANIGKVEVKLPIALPSRLTTLQKACLDSQFNVNPAGCPEASVVGSATAITPLLGVPLTGPAYLVSHANAGFPDLVFLLQGEGIHIELVGHTDIKKGITISRFESVPDAPISSFETVLPRGPHSILTGNGNLCTQSLIAPTKLVGQNGAVVTQETPVTVSGCAPAKPSVKIVKSKVKGNTLLLTVKTSGKGTVKISGASVKAMTKRGLGAGTHQLKIPLSNAGKAAKRQHKKLKVRASLTVGSQSVSKTAAVKA